MSPRFLLSLIASASLAGAWYPATPDRRIVDRVEVGNPHSETQHGYEGRDAIAGVAGGVPFRQTRQWLHYALTTFDDTEVTLALTFVGLAGDSTSREVDVVVEDSLVATRTVRVPAGNISMVEVAVPFTLTKGKSGIIVFIRARGGLTPALRELRTIQDHYELASVSTFPGVAR